MLMRWSMPRRASDANAETPRPMSRRLEANLRDYDIKGEKAIAVAQAAICVFILILHAIALHNAGRTIVHSWVAVAVGLLIASSAIRWWLATRPVLSERTLDFLNIFDVAVFLSLIWSYQYAYTHPASGSLKAPSFVLLLVLIALRALRFHPRPILIAGAAAMVGWSFLVCGAVVKDGMQAVTHDYYSYLGSFHILIGAEVEKIVALSALTALLATATYGARQLLGKAAHAADYADALDSARRHLDEATTAKEKAESALEELDRSKADLVEQNRRFNAALGNMRVGLCMFDQDQRLLVCNDRYLEMYRLPKNLAVPGTPFRAIVEARISAGLYGGERPDDYRSERLAAVGAAEATTKVQEMSDGRTIVIMHEPMAHGGWVATHEDITPLRQIQARMSHMTRHDALTDLPNRLLLRERVEEVLTRTNGDSSLVVLLFDIDRFKEVNDSLGPSIGDALLQGVAQRLLRRVRGIEMIARVGGDEFVVLQVSDQPASAAVALAKKIQSALGTSFDLDGHQIIISTTFGIAVGPDDGSDPDQLLKGADLALTRAKKEAQGSYRFFEPDMDLKMQARHQMERDLRAAITNNELELYYQPRLDLASNEISGFEALLRWNHPTRGIVSPTEFIPLAEETGLIVPIGDWVLRQACKEAKTWRRGLNVSVNLSSVQFRLGNVRQSVITALGISQLSPSNLELEVTESVILQESAEVAGTLCGLQDLGVKIAMDDFGTGYSSLSYLHRFRFDKIKIDQMFVKELGERPQNSLAILRAVVALGHSFGIATTAEGVETAEQLEVVRREGCTEAQGFYVGRPGPAREIPAMLARASQGAAGGTLRAG